MPKRYRREERDWPHQQQNWQEQNRPDWRDEDYNHRRGREMGDDDWNERYAGLGGRGWYEGWSDAMHRGEGPHAGRGPRNYTRTDSRIEEDINERLTEHSMLDATDIEVAVQNGEVTLRGYVDHRQAKRLAEDIAESVFGVKEVNNQIKVKQRGWVETATPEERRKTG